MSTEYKAQLDKTDIIRLIAKDTGYRQSAIEEIFESFVDHVVKGMENNCRVKISGIGVFEPRVRAPRVGRNVKKGVAVHIPSKVVPFFIPSDRLKKAVAVKEVNKK